MTRGWWAGVLWLAMCAGVSAQWRQPAEGPIATDRPGNGNAATTVTRGHLNLEASALYARPDGSTTHQLSFPMLLRLGVLDRLEVRLGSGLAGYAHVGDQGRWNPTDLSMGLKVQALRADGARPDLAISSDVFLPSGDGSFTSGAVVAEVRGLAAWSLPRGFGLLLNAGLDVPEDAVGQRYARALYVVNASYSPPACAGRLSAFVEIYGLQGLQVGRAQVVQFDWGMSALLDDALQLDFYFQHGLTEAASDLQVSVGCSARF